MANVKQEDVKVGSRIKVRNVVLTVTGQDKYGFTAEQDYKGQKHPMTIPFDSFDNPHMIPMELAPRERIESALSTIDMVVRRQQ